ncbi:hypothetical protein L1987_64279 [Smallanthus sonchifolius]|uniref:Uncharacterized protein n=1 Tax=Smallanthus sonchifolius TaxID=185202 RepID=A0ACB9CG16_9ASTR|nr:hypothetical protein L1987_64279 [Smallanthus sonchifolius]
MNQARKSPQLWNRSSNSKSGSLYGLQPEAKKETSIFGFIAKVLTCRSWDIHIPDDYHHHAPPATLQYSTHNSLRSNKNLNHSASSTPSKASIDVSDELSFQDICNATENFSASNIIGKGGFGTVYKGTLKNGSIIAIKRAKKNGPVKGTQVEFKNEILALSKIEHLNLVRFYGYIEHGDERVILVEYVSHGNLREHLDGKRGSGLEIGERLDIMIDIAHAVTYLHTYTVLPLYVTIIANLIINAIIILQALQRLKGGEVVMAMDPKLKRNPASLMVVEKVLRLARKCVAPKRQSRPSMMQCAEILWRIRKDYHEHNDVMATADHSVQVPQIDARKNHQKFFGTENSSNQRFQSA